MSAETLGSSGSIATVRATIRGAAKTWELEPEKSLDSWGSTTFVLITFKDTSTSTPN